MHFDSPPAEYGKEKNTWDSTLPTSSISLTSQYETSPALAKVLWHAGKYKLVRPLVVTVEPDQDAYMARCAEIPQVFGLADTARDALDALGVEVESLWNDLQEDDAFTEEWLKLRERLAKIIGDAK